MSPRDALYVAALLQDAGVFIGRSGLDEWRERADTLAAAGHRGLSAALIDHFSPRKPFLPPLSELPPFWNAAGAPAHAAEGDPRRLLLHLLRIAETCAAPGAGTAPDAAPGTRLQSPVSHLVLHRSQEALRLERPLYLDVAPLSTARESLFPAGQPPADQGGAYARAVRSFVDDFERIGDEAGLFALLEKYLVTVPPRTGGDVSLFDVARTTAAIALCLYDEYATGSWQGQGERISRGDTDGLPPPCLLVVGSFSGIQDFIFDVPTKRASKSLKGRSFYVQLAAEAAVRRIVGELELKDGSLLYSGGGSFVLLAPALAAERLDRLRVELGDALINESLSLSLGWAPVDTADFRDGSRFSARWSEAHVQLERRKRRRFQELGARIFVPFAQRPRDEQGTDDPFARRTEKLSRSVGYRFVQRPRSASPGEGQFLARMGLEDEYTTREDRDFIAFNDTEFAGRFRSRRFAVKDLPRWTEKLLARLYPAGDAPKELAKDNVIDFNHLAQLAQERTGTGKLGVLKMDVDNLGQLFVHGFGETGHGVTRVAALSRTLQWFFEGYVNELLKGSFTWTDRGGNTVEEVFAEQLYPVFSGGDDFFLVGAWDAVFEFARRVRQEFREFVGDHPGITLSAALMVVDPKESISRFAERADDRLEEAKLEHEDKDRISVFNQILTWNDFGEAVRLKERLERLVKQGQENRQIVQRVQQSAFDFERLEVEAGRGVFRIEKVWRLAYYLRRNVKKANRDEISRIAEQHEQLLLKAYIAPDTAPSPALFLVAGRWAELATRRVPEAGSDALESG